CQFSASIPAFVDRAAKNTIKRGGEMNIQKATLSIGSCLLLTGLGLPVYAQTPANSFEEMRAMPQVRIGEKVEVTDETGKKFKAAINGISDNSLDVTVHGIRRELWESQVSRFEGTARERKGLDSNIFHYNDLPADITG